ncbi:SNU114 [Candida oxycetoniae]|uniref:SNU114 n=1 Tax=Candida oxycetoniae TaxID=497107 RepID=A0AAI9SVX7_9ASCO|nr:SNU114 [Candida oxycetoniae]KAI3403695.2 SNU114 [Candida oxycetoniae]
MEEEDLYDEFGNYIGSSKDSDVESIENNVEATSINNVEGQQAMALTRDEEEPDLTEEATSQALVKSRSVAKNEGEMIFIDAIEPLSERPVISPNVQKQIKEEVIYEDNLASFGQQQQNKFLKDTMNKVPERIRNITIMGSHQSGKTRLIDSLLLHSHTLPSETAEKLKSAPRYLDNHRLEIDREMTIKTSAMTMILEDKRNRSFAFNILDTPGHVDFNDEVIAALELSDGAVLVLDVVIGVTFQDQKLINEIMKRNMPLVLVINKIDRLILELQLPPKDAYFKIFNIIDDVNQLIQQSEYFESFSHQKEFSPLLDNVVFASADFGIFFSLRSFTELYSQTQVQLKADFDEEFVGMLWGEYFFDPQQNAITDDSRNGQLSRTFVAFVLDTLYKITSLVLISMPSDKKLPKLLWQNFGVSIPKREYKKDIKQLLKVVFMTIFEGNTGFVDSITSHIPSPLSNLSNTGNESRILGKIAKLVETSDGKAFFCLARVYSGNLKVGDSIGIYTGGSDKDAKMCKQETIGQIFIPGGRCNFPVTETGLGTIVLIEGIDSSIKKGATIANYTEEAPPIFEIPRYSINSVFKVAIEPEDPRQRPLLLESLRKVNKSYLSTVINVEESGEITVLAPGELSMDCVLHDVRIYFADDLRINVSDPLTVFSETCTQTSFTKIPVSTNTGEFTISIIAEPVNDPQLSYAIESGKLNIHQTKREISSILKKDFDWDALAAKSVWSFGPDDLIEPDILLDDTLEMETDKVRLLELKELIKSGFTWSISEGPLIGDTIRNTKFKILDATFKTKTDSSLNSAQIIPLIRRACYTGLLTANPRLLEPIYRMDCICFYNNIRVINELLKSRRGYIKKQEAIEGTPLHHVEGYLPVIDSFGFASDVKQHCQGKASVSLIFSHWQIVPGDPFDMVCQLPRLKPVPEESLSRDFLLKTRKQKGLTGEPTLQKYIDPEFYEKLKERGLVL